MYSTFLSTPPKSQEGDAAADLSCHHHDRSHATASTDDGSRRRSHAEVDLVADLPTIVALQNQVYKLKTDADGLRSRLAATDEERLHWETQRDALRSDLRITRQELEDSRAQQKACQRTLDTNRKALEELQLAHCEVTADRDALMEKVREAWERVAALTALSSASAADKTVMEAALQQATGHAQQQQTSLQARLEAWDGHVRSLTEEQATMSAAYAAASQATTAAAQKIAAAVAALNRSYVALLTGSEETPADADEASAGGENRPDAVIAERERDLEEALEELGVWSLAPLVPALRGISNLLRRLRADHGVLRRQLRDVRLAREVALDSLDDIRKAQEWRDQQADLQRQLATKTQQATAAEEATRRAAMDAQMRCRALSVALDCAEDWTLVRHRVVQLVQQHNEHEAVVARQQERHQQEIRLGMEALQSTFDAERGVWAAEKQHIMERCLAAETAAREDVSRLPKASVMTPWAMASTPTAANHSNTVAGGPTAEAYETLKVEYADVLRYVEDLAALAQSHAHQTRQTDARIAQLEAERARLVKEVAALRGGKPGGGGDETVRLLTLLHLLVRAYTGLAKDFGEVIQQRRALTRSVEAFHAHRHVDGGDLLHRCLTVPQRWEPSRRRYSSALCRFRVAVIAVVALHRLREVMSPTLRECWWPQPLPIIGCARVCHRVRMPVETRTLLVDADSSTAAPGSSSYHRLTIALWEGFVRGPIHRHAEGSSSPAGSPRGESELCLPPFLGLLQDAVTAPASDSRSRHPTPSVPLHLHLQAGLVQYRLGGHTGASLSAAGAATRSQIRSSGLDQSTATQRAAYYRTHSITGPVSGYPPASHGDEQRAREALRCRETAVDRSPWDSPVDGRTAPSSVEASVGALLSATSSEVLHEPLSSSGQLPLLSATAPLSPQMRYRSSTPPPLDARGGSVQHSRSLGHHSSGANSMADGLHFPTDGEGPFTVDVLSVIAALDRRVSSALMKNGAGA